VALSFSAEAPRDEPDLRGPVHLVAAEVEQRHHPGLGGPEHRGDVLLVHLQHRVRRFRCRAQRGAHWLHTLTGN